MSLDEGVGQTMERPNSSKSETKATQQNKRTNPTTQGINTKPITNVTNPNIIRAREIARNTEAKVEGEETNEVVVEWKGLGIGGDRRI
ncbi:hypothetical protein Vadar_010001 [Vaccinium darrowii]|uniref:Uncharacterized protein n=1 Tax=Vaccinium darrowii TaxID=229202 RepID=A0ACB7YCN7_9ERIC|nr:hypothetical protein Vadar_010001 [Vaccinium darrowii]